MYTKNKKNPKLIKNIQKSTTNLDLINQYKDTQQTQQDKITKAVNWSPFAYADLQYVIEMANKSILSKLENRQIIQNLKKFQQKLYEQVQDTDVNGYFWIMMLINRLLDDDHSSIKLNNLQQIQTLDFCGLIFDVKIEDNSLKVYVIRSFIKNINVGDQVIKINKIPVQQFVNTNAKKYIKSTYSPITNIKKYVLYMCLLNPFDPIKSIEVISDDQQDKTVNLIKSPANKQHQPKYTYKQTKDQKYIMLDNLQYYQANQRYFSGFTNIFELMREQLIQDEKRTNQLDITSLKQGKMLYYDIHAFLNFGDNIQKIEQSIQQLITPSYEWIVIDLRNNPGGSIYLSLLLSSYLFDYNIISQYKECQTASFNLNEEFLTKYNEQYIIPVIADPQVSSGIKQKFIQMQSYLLKKQQSLFLNTVVTKSTKNKCNKDLISSYNKKLSKYILTNFENENLKLNKQKRHSSKEQYVPFKKIVLITNLHCYSACIHTYNFMRLFPNVVTIGHQIGKTTGSGNSVQIQLPSQQAHVILPQLFVNNINPIFHNSMTQTTNVDIQLDSDTLLSKQALIVFILENKRNLLDIIKKRAEQFK